MDPQVTVCHGRRKRRIFGWPLRRFRQEVHMYKFINFFFVFMTLILAGIADLGATAQASSTRVQAARSAGAILVDNDRPEVVVLFVNDRFEAMVPATSQRRISLPEGRHEVELRLFSGKSLSQSKVQVRRGRTATIYVPELETRTVRLTNRVRKDVTAVSYTHLTLPTICSV